MKSLSKWALASSMIILLAGCGGSEAEQTDSTNSVTDVNEVIITETTTETIEEETTTAETTEPTIEGVEEDNITNVIIPSPGSTPDVEVPDKEASADGSESIVQPETSPQIDKNPELEPGETEPTIQPETPHQVDKNPEIEPAPEPPETESTEPVADDTSENTDTDLGSPNISDNTISAEYLNQVERKLTDTPLMISVKASIATLDNTLVEQISPLSAANPANVKRVESMLSASDWQYIFPKRAPEYSYDKFLKAVGKFPAFCGDYDDGRDTETICRKSLATMFAHFTQETGGHSPHWDVQEWRQGLVHVREMGWNETMRGGYNGECNPTIWQGKTWPCGTFDNGEYISYFGRGAKQLSYNFNYGPFSAAMFGDVSVLLKNPELVADTWLNLASAVFFFVYPQPPKPSMLHVIDGTWQANEHDISDGLVSGFGVTTQIINGGVECDRQTEITQSLNRISYYQSFSNYLGVDIPNDERLGCAEMKAFDSDGDGALNIYWEQDWSFIADNPGGVSYACKLVGYQTPFSAFKEGDYSQCVQRHFDVIAVED